MSDTIWKYELPITDRVTLDLPVGAWALTVQEQGGVLCLWAAVNTAARTERRTFLIAGTGNPFDAGGLGYIGTAQMSSGLVWHVFELVEGPRISA